MDSVLFDQMHLEQKELEAENNEPRPEASGGGTVASDYVVAGDLATGSGPEGSTGGSDYYVDSDHYVDSDLATSTTVPITNEGATGLDPGAKRTSANTSARSSTSSSGSSDQRSIGFGSASLYQPEFMAPKINYERANEAQKLAAVIGREFDRPSLVASTLQKLVSEQPGSKVPVVKFVPFTLRRKVLLKGSFDSRELRKHDLICMCYNASEARILLTGPDGFYTSLLKHVESLLGPNKVAFLITHYTTPASQPEPVTVDSTHISPSLKTRLHNQPPLRVYLGATQVLSWNDEPTALHVQRLTELANSEPNPQRTFVSDSCCLL